MERVTRNKALWCWLLAALLFIVAVPHVAGAAEAVPPKLSVELLSPAQVKDFPGIEQLIKAKVTNMTDQPISDVMAYITLADLGKHMTVNLEDYSADKPVVIGTLQPKESKIIELPIRFVYTSNFFLYVTVVSSQFTNIQSSGAIPIEIISNTSMDPSLVTMVSFGMPALLLIVIAVVFMLRWKQRRDSALS
jgi:hypothetical protein